MIFIGYVFILLVITNLCVCAWRVDSAGIVQFLQKDGLGWLCQDLRTML